MKHYEVLVSNIGTVYSGTSAQKAKEQYNESVALSKAGYGRFAGESVTMIVDSEIDQEYNGTNSED